MKKAILAVTAISALCASALLPANAQAADSPLFPAISLIAGFLNQGIFPESDLYTTDDDIIINATDGVELAANVFVPTTGSGPYPAVIFINSWAANEYQYLTEAARFAETGQALGARKLAAMRRPVWSPPRGQGTWGRSNGCQTSCSRGATATHVLDLLLGF